MMMIQDMMAYLIHLENNTSKPLEGILLIDDIFCV